MKEPRPSLRAQEMKPLTAVGSARANLAGSSVHNSRACVEQWILKHNRCGKKSHGMDDVSLYPRKNEGGPKVLTELTW